MKKSMEDKNEKIKTLIVENHEATAVGTKQILEENFPNCKPIVIAKNDEEARKLIKDEPELIVMDIKLGTKEQPSVNGVALANEFGERSNKSKVILYSGYNNGYIIRSFKTDCINGYILKDSPLERFTSAVHSILNGVGWVLDIDVTPRDIDIILRFIKETHSEVLYLSASGFGKYQETAEIMMIESSTVRSHYFTIKASLQASEIGDTIEEFAKKLYPFPDPKDKEIFGNILGSWHKLSMILDALDQENSDDQLINIFKKADTQVIFDIFLKYEDVDLHQYVSNLDDLKKFYDTNKESKKSNRRQIELEDNLKKFQKFIGLLIYSKDMEDYINFSEILHKELGVFYECLDENERKKNVQQEKKEYIKLSRNNKERIKKCYISALFFYKHIILKSKKISNTQREECIRNTLLLHEKLGDIFKSSLNEAEAEKHFSKALSINEDHYPKGSAARKENSIRLEEKLKTI